MSSQSSGRKMSVVTISMLIVVTTFGLANVIDNLAEIGLTAIPSWVLVAFLYFLPMALILAEFASANQDSTGGIYSFMELGLGPTWAFVGTWSYFVANLVYLQSVFSRLPIRMSLAATGGDVFETATGLLPLLGVLLCVVLTYVATRGVRVFSHLADWLGKVTLVQVGLLVVVPLAAVAIGWHRSATPFSLPAMIPTLDLDYFSTFSWLLFAVAGAEVAAPYVKQTRDPQRNFPRAILFSTLLIGSIYVLASLAVAMLVPVTELTKATGLYDIWLPWADLLHLPAAATGRTAMIVYVCGATVAYIIWMESPIRAMFAEVPRGTFPERLTQHDTDGTHRYALWTQAWVVCLLILVPLLSILAGLQGSEAFISLLNDLASLSLVIPYVFLALSYIRARKRGLLQAPFQAARSTPVALAIGYLVLAVSAAGYFGAGLYALQADPIDWLYVGIVYGGPIVLIGLGLLLRAWSLRAHHTRGADASGA